MPVLGQQEQPPKDTGARKVAIAGGPVTDSQSLGHGLDENLHPLQQMSMRSQPPEPIPPRFERQGGAQDGRPARIDKKDITCWKCGEKGHYANECTQVADNGKGGNGKGGKGKGKGKGKDADGNLSPSDAELGLPPNEDTVVHLDVKARRNQNRQSPCITHLCAGECRAPKSLPGGCRHSHSGDGFNITTEEMEACLRDLNRTRECRRLRTSAGAPATQNDKCTNWLNGHCLNNGCMKEPCKSDREAMAGMAAVS